MKNEGIPEAWNCNCYNNCDENNDSVSDDDFT